MHITVFSCAELPLTMAMSLHTRVHIQFKCALSLTVSVRNEATFNATRRELWGGGRCRDRTLQALRVGGTTLQCHTLKTTQFSI
jgi:hypothetical protein